MIWLPCVFCFGVVVGTWAAQRGIKLSERGQ
jgi:hypothetical protein